MESFEHRLLLAGPDIIAAVSLNQLSGVWGSNVSFAASANISGGPLTGGQSYNAYLKLSTDSTIDAGDYTWDSKTGQTTACSFNSPKGLPGTPPSGFPGEGTIYVGVLVVPNFTDDDPANNTAYDPMTVSRTGRPTITNLVPADDATGVAVGVDLVITWSKTVEAGGGELEIRQSSNGSLALSLASEDDWVVWSGNTSTIVLPSELSSNTEYYVLLLGGGFAISSPRTWG